MAQKKAQHSQPAAIDDTGDDALLTAAAAAVVHERELHEAEQAEKQKKLEREAAQQRLLEQRQSMWLFLSSAIANMKAIAGAHGIAQPAFHSLTVDSDEEITEEGPSTAEGDGDSPDGPDGHDLRPVLEAVEAAQPAGSQCRFLVVRPKPRRADPSRLEPSLGPAEFPKQDEAAGLQVNPADDSRLGTRPAPIPDGGGATAEAASQPHADHDSSRSDSQKQPRQQEACMCPSHSAKGREQLAGVTLAKFIGGFDHEDFHRLIGTDLEDLRRSGVSPHMLSSQTLMNDVLQQLLPLLLPEESQLIAQHVHAMDTRGEAPLTEGLRKMLCPPLSKGSFLRAGDSFLRAGDRAAEGGRAGQESNRARESRADRQRAKLKSKLRTREGGVPGEVQEQSPREQPYWQDELRELDRIFERGYLHHEARTYHVQLQQTGHLQEAPRLMFAGPGNSFLANWSMRDSDDVLKAGKARATRQKTLTGSGSKEPESPGTVIDASSLWQFSQRQQASRRSLACNQS